MTFEERLIHLVHEREPLWNLKLPPEQRSKDTKEKLWKEIHSLFGQKYTIQGLRKRWKSLVDTHRKYVNNIGADGPSNKRRMWAHYNSMSFMRDICDEVRGSRQRKMGQKTVEEENSINVSNMPILEEFLSNGEINNQPTYVFDQSNYENVQVESDDEVVDSQKHKNAVSIFKFPEIPPPPKVPQTANAAFGLFIECSLEEIKDPSDRVKVQCALMNTLTAELSKIAERHQLTNVVTTDNEKGDVDNNIHSK